MKDGQDSMVMDAEEPASTDISSTRQSPPQGGGERKPLLHKDLRQPSQLATDNAPPKDPGAIAAAEMLRSPDLPQQIIGDVHALGVVGEDDLILMAYVTATGRAMEKAIHLCVYGEYSSGKSYAVGKVLDLFPPDEVFRATQVTPKHLLNLKDEDAEVYRHKVIFIGELTSGEGDLCFREMAESGEVQNLTVRDGTAQRSKTKGPITFIATTTLSPGDMKDEDASRWFYFLTDDTQAQTQRVMEAAARRAKDPSQAEDKEAIIQKHRWAQVVLKNASGVQVIVPFADLIKLPSEDPHSRRLFAKILLLLQAVTFLCQFREGRHRDEVDGVTRVFADAEDWRIALPLIEAIVRQKYGCGDQADKDFFADVQKLGRGPFSIEDLAKKLSVSPSTVRRRIGKLPPSSFEKFWHQGMHMHSFHDGDHFSTVPGLPTYEEVRDYLAQPVPVKR